MKDTSEDYTKEVEKDEVSDNDDALPFFQLDPRDRHAPGTIRDYLTRLWSDSQVSDGYKDQVVQACREIERWQADNRERVTTPSEFGEIREA